MLRLVQEKAVLDVLLVEFWSVVSKAQKVKSGSVRLLDVQDDVISRTKYWRSYSDVDHVITNLPVAQYILYHNTEPFSLVRLRDPEASSLFLLSLAFLPSLSLSSLLSRFAP